MATDSEILASMHAAAGKPGAFSAPLQEPAQFANAQAQLNYEITEMARKSEVGDQRSEVGPTRKKRARLGALANECPTKQDVLEEFRRADLRPLWVGRVAYLWSEGEPDRAAALKQLKTDLVSEDMVSAAGRLDQFITIYWVARLLGWDEAQGLRVAAIRELRRLVARNAATEEFAIRRQCVGPARHLWARMAREKLTAAAVKAEVDAIRPAKPSSVKMHGRAGAVVKLLREVGRLRKADDLIELIRAAQQRLEAIRPVSTAVA
jgi:hypothetical protein